MKFAISYNSVFQPLATLLGTGPAHSGVDVEADRIDVRMGWAFRASIPRSAVQRAEQIDRIPPLLGLGVHGWGGRWAVNGSQRGAVRVTIDPPARARVLGIPVNLSELLLSLDEPEAFVVAVGRSGTSTFG